jgi:hypothetical protein
VHLDGFIIRNISGFVAQNTQQLLHLSSFEGYRQVECKFDPAHDIKAFG